MGVVAGARQIIGAVVAHGGAGAGAACQQAALGAVAALHHTGRGRECLIRQVLSLIHILSWIAETALSASSRLMMQEILISLVEIILMLMLLLDSASNIRCV